MRRREGKQDRLSLKDRNGNSRVLPRDDEHSYFHRTTCQKTAQGEKYPSKTEIPGLESGLDDIEESGELRSIELIEGTNLRKDDDLVGGIVGANRFENLT